MTEKEEAVATSCHVVISFSYKILTLTTSHRALNPGGGLKSGVDQAWTLSKDGASVWRCRVHLGRGTTEAELRLSSPAHPCSPPGRLVLPRYLACPLLTAGLGAQPGGLCWWPPEPQVQKLLCLGNGTRPSQLADNLPSMGVLGSGRLANTTSTYSSCSRSREAFRPGRGVGRDSHYLHRLFWALIRARNERDEAPGTGSWQRAGKHVWTSDSQGHRKPDGSGAHRYGEFRPFRRTQGTHRPKAL